MEKRKNLIIFSAVLVLGFLIRIYFVEKIVVGDIFNYQEWGRKLIENGSKNYYFKSNWYYSPPVYPPISILSYGATYYLFEHKYILPQLHNLIKIPPASFIIYFYKYGDILLLKLPSILADLLLSVIIYKLIFKFTKNKKRSMFGSLFYLFNPISIFLSGAWGQSDSLVALIGLVSFLLVINRNMMVSIPLMFLGLYFKPSWAVLLPFYFYLIYLEKPKIKELIFGGVLALIIFVATTLPFSDKNVFTYGWELFSKRYPIPLGSSSKASVSAFNFQTIFFKLDIDYAKGNFGLFAYIVANIIAFINYKKQKNNLFGMLSGVFIIGLGAFLFLPAMLERYFFPAFVPLVVLAFSTPKLLLNLIIVNLIFFSNIIYAFYRRGSDEIYHLFIDYNFILIKFLSIVLTYNFLIIVKRILSDKINLWRK